MAAPLAIAVSLLLSSGNLRAFGPGGVGNGNGSATGAATASGTSGAAAATGGAHGSASSAGASRGSLSAPTGLGTRSGVSFSNNAPRAYVGNYSQGSSSRAGAPAGYAQGTRTTTLTAARATNAWSGTAVEPGGNVAARRSSDPLNFPNGSAGRGVAGRGSSPAWYNGNSGSGRYNNGNYNGRRRSPYGYSNYPYAYGPYYAPYLGYYGGFDGAYPYAGDGGSSDVGGGYDGITPSVTPQYAQQGEGAANDQQGPAPQAAPQNQNGGNAQSTIPNNGPDSLVEAVQEELIRRGYFAGKVDAMYGPDTKDSLRKFQADHHLADTGLINEATLHALQLD